jgi:hypothetical protein
MIIEIAGISSPQENIVKKNGKNITSKLTKFDKILKIEKKVEILR